jgi:hypothetical protein
MKNGSWHRDHGKSPYIYLMVLLEKVCQMDGCTRRSRRKQTSKWERESMFRASSVVKEELSFYLSRLVAPSMYVSPNYHVVLPQHVITLVGRRYMIQPCHVMIV